MLMRDRSRVQLGGFFSSLGLPGLGQGTPSKLTIWYEQSSPRDYAEKFELPFNPATLSSWSSVRWRAVNLAATVQKRSYALTFNSDAITPATLSFDVSIDTYEGAPGGGGGWGSLISVPNPTALHLFTPPSGVSVLPYTAQVAALQLVNTELHRPPLCEVWWGNVRLIEGPLTSLTQQFTRFLPDGTPVRANLNCTFTDASIDSGELNFGTNVQKTHTVRLGDTLQAIAARCYGDATRWRGIAEANDIDDPRVLTPGTVLTIPAIR